MLYLDEEAQGDIAKIEDQECVDLLLQLLSEIKRTPRLQEALLDESDCRFALSADFNTTRFWHMFGRGYDVWRMKVFDLEGYAIGYRVIYAFDIVHRDIYVLAVMPREIDYESDPEFIARLEATYVRLGLSVHRRR